MNTHLHRFSVPRPKCWGRFACIIGVVLALTGQTLLGNNPAKPPEKPKAEPATATAKVESSGTNSPPKPTEKPQESVEDAFSEALKMLKTAKIDADPFASEIPSAIITNVVTLVSTNNTREIRDFQIQMELARTLRHEKNTVLATKTFVSILQSGAPAPFKRLALFELALAALDSGQLLKAQQIFAQYLQLFGEDPGVPDVLLRQGLLYRKMGVNTLAISKFYAVMSTSLKLKLDNLEYYKKLVEQAQIEIAETYYLEGKYEEAADFFNRLTKTSLADETRTQIQHKLVRSLSYLPDHVETISKAQLFLEHHPESPDVPEIRFLLASAMKNLGRNQDAMKQVLLLLQSQEDNVKKNPETWLYWQQKAGNGIANQLYKEGDFINALEVYLGLAELDKTPIWQIPVWYQVGLVYEQLGQPDKAREIYAQIEARQKDVSAETSTPSLQSIFDMAKWRKDYVAWIEKARTTQKMFQRSGSTTNSVEDASL